MDWDGTLQAFDVPVGQPGSSFDLGIGFPDPAMRVEHPEMKRGKGRSDPGNKTKKRLSNNQLEMLEESFQEGLKLDPDRKIMLSRELGLEPRQVAVWFQNRRARWKAKQMEVLYMELRQEFDVTCKEKLKLQEEALRLKSILRFRAAGKKQLALGSPGEQTGGSSSPMPIHSSMNEAGFPHRHDIDASSTGLFGSDEYDAVAHPFYHSNTP